MGCGRAMLLTLCPLINSNIGMTLEISCEEDQQCGGRMCCAVSLWIRSLRMCTPMGNLGEECHPLSHRVSRHPARGQRGRRRTGQFPVPFPGRRMHHTCPCLPGLACVRTFHNQLPARKGVS
uniref:Prokineticin 2 n=1 Tax=Dromaius novaehollandiae TaxID=8790 RepID=A0A8C4KA40_DRONO